MRDNRNEFKLVLESLKARELKTTDPAQLAEVKSQIATWESMYQAAGGDPARVKPASFANDLRESLAKTGFPALDPDRYLDAEKDIATLREYQVAASDLGGPDKDVLLRREANLQRSLEARKTRDKLTTVGIGMAQLSWIAAVPAFMTAGAAGGMGCVGLLVGGLGLHFYSQHLERKSQSEFMRNTPSGDVMTLAKWRENGPRLVEEFAARQAERYNTAWMEKALKPEPSGITETQGAIMVGGVRLKTRGG